MSRGAAPTRTKVELPNGTVAKVDLGDARRAHDRGAWHACAWAPEHKRRAHVGWTCAVCGRWLNMPGYRNGERVARG